MAKKEFTRNEAVALMHRNSAQNLRDVADHIEKWKLTAESSVGLLREMADGLEEAAIDTDMRDSKGYRIEDRGESGAFMVTG